MFVFHQYAEAAAAIYALGVAQMNTDSNSMELKF